MRHHDCTDQDLMYIDDLLVSQAALGTESFLSSQFSAFPNPASNVINVSNKNSKITSIDIVDLNGRTVKHASYDNVSNLEMNIADLTAGVYMMNIKSTEGVATKKIVKN